MANALAWISTYLYRQDFESGLQPSGWSGVPGTPVWNYNTAPAPLVGNYSLGVATNAITAEYDYGSEIAEVYGFFIINDATGNQPLFSMNDGLHNIICVIDQRQGAGLQSIRIGFDGNSGNQTVATFTAPTTIYVWFHYLAGTGANAVSEVWWSTTTTKPATGGNNYATTGSGSPTTGARYFRIPGGQTSFDYFRLSSSPIGSNPP